MKAGLLGVRKVLRHYSIAKTKSILKLRRSQELLGIRVLTKHQLLQYITIVKLAVYIQWVKLAAIYY